LNNSPDTFFPSETPSPTVVIETLKKIEETEQFCIGVSHVRLAPNQRLANNFFDKKLLHTIFSQIEPVRTVKATYGD
jgi:hypothetical protein